MDALLKWIYPLPQGLAHLPPDFAHTWEGLLLPGGTTVLPLFVLGLIGVLLLVISLAVVAIKRARMASGLPSFSLLGLGLTVLLIGLVGRQVGRSTLEENHRTAVQQPDSPLTPDELEDILAHGHAAAAIPFRLGLLFGVPFLLGGIALRPRHATGAGERIPAS